MRFTKWLLTVSVMVSGFSSPLFSGPYQNTGISWLDTEILSWASEAIEFRPTSTGSDRDLATNSLGPADGAFTSLGDLDAHELAMGHSPGSIVLTFPTSISNGPGWDFAIFENAGAFFEPPVVFAELASVSVSTNGRDYSHFPIESLNVEPGEGDADTELTASFGRDFAGLNPTNVKNLAGIHQQGVGTAFDLDDLRSTEEVLSEQVDLNAIHYIRLTDIPGNGSRLDFQGRPILDAWPTGGSTGGFDLDAIGVRYAAPCPACPIGDFDLDGQWDVDDVEQLSQAIANSHGASRFDLNADNYTNLDDLTDWVEVLAQTYLGDTNLDGEFNSQDLIRLFQAGEYEDDLEQNSTWSTGDFNADQEFDSDDIIAVFQSGGFEKGPRVVTLQVPEPSTGLTILYGTLALLVICRRLLVSAMRSEGNRAARSFHSSRI